MSRVFAVLACVFSVCTVRAEESKEKDVEKKSSNEELVELQQRLVEQEQRFNQQQAALFQQQQMLEAQRKELSDLRKQVATLTSGRAAMPKPNEPTQVHKDLIRSGFHTKLYGFLRGDYEADTQRMNFDPQLPFFVLSPQTTAGRRGDSTFHSRLTRVGMDVTGPASSIIKGWTPTAKLEVDFFNAFIGQANLTGPARDLVSNSRSALRIRHAYVRLQSRDWFFQGGQTWDVISPLFPSLNADTVMWNAGNTADRRPQLRIGYEPKLGPGKLSMVAMVGSSGAVDGADLDNNGVRDGEERAIPTFQARLGYSAPSWIKGQDMAFGIYGHRAEQRTAIVNFGGKSDFESFLIGSDLSLPLTKRIKLQGEWWFGQDLGDVRGGIGQTINPATGREIKATGGWGELSFKTNRFYTVNLGYTLDKPRASMVPGGGRTRNRTIYVTNRFALGSGIDVGLDFANWITHFNGLSPGENNRITIFVQHNF